MRYYVEHAPIHSNNGMLLLLTNDVTANKVTELESLEFFTRTY